MLVSHRKRFIYTKTQKTAGTSVESYFEKYCLPDGEWEFSHAREVYVGKEGIIGYRGRGKKDSTWYNHMPAQQIKEQLGDGVWESYFKFCVIRNPFDKLLSHFYYLVKKEMLDPDIYRDDEIASFRNWLKRGGSIIDRDKYMIEDRVCLDYYIRYEKLHEGIRAVCNKLQIPFEPEKVPKLKSGMRNYHIPIKDYFDDQSIKIVRDLFAFELDYFEYDFPA